MHIGVDDRQAWSPSVVDRQAWSPSVVDPEAEEI
jgi:hypothetical protein